METKFNWKKFLIELGVTVLPVVLSHTVNVLSKTSSDIDITAVPSRNRRHDDPLVSLTSEQFDAQFK